MPDFSFEYQYPAPIAGVDEAGRGPWAGPVVAAAVILDPRHLPKGLDDSKKLSAKRREVLFDELQTVADVAVGMGSVAEIDQLNIARANDLAMRRALDGLSVRPGFVLIDGAHVPHQLELPARAIPKGDGISLSIAAASIIAKVTRDRLMVQLDAQHPGYGWARNMGYGTAQHRAALKQLGVTPAHRRSFRPIREVILEEDNATY
ncbi:MAG: ribonuclease HII [Pseudomonadota bacterium]